jgi:release factor glutamine methyltransferase
MSLSTLESIYTHISDVSDSAALDAQVLLAHVLGKPRAWVLAHPEVRLTSPQAEALQEALDRLQKGEPLPFVLGHWEFFGLDMLVAPTALIPRPETELLVEGALEWLKANPARRQAADVGTGSGCIAVALAKGVHDLHILATDLSLSALQIARQNADRHQVGGRVHCLQADLLPPLKAGLDLLCANLPYIPSPKLNDLRVAQREPRLALDGGPDGLRLIRRLLCAAGSVMRPGGLLLLEIEASQGAAARALARSAFPIAEVTVLPDLAGLDRLLRIMV